MGGDKSGDAAVEQVRQDRAGERRALLGIGAASQFVKQHERLGVGFL